MQARFARWASGTWFAFVILYIIATVVTYFVSSFLFEGILGSPVFWIFFVVLLIGIVYNPVALRAKKFKSAFIASAMTIIGMIGITGVSLFPRMVPSSTDLINSLTIYNASSTPRTLTVMLVIALIGMPIVLLYTGFIYRVFKGKVVISDDSY
jgi:cytochrome d ubiquinol oxidase subunit II